MLRRRLQRWIPSPDAVRANRTLRWLGPLLERPWLWQLSRRRVAAGAAIGVFFGFLVPVAQIACAALLAIALRANLPVAAVATFVTNPVTFAPVYVAAYHTGARLLGEPPDEEAARALADGADPAALPGSMRERASRMIRPWATGLVVFAVLGAAVAWASVHVAWIASVRLRRRRRRARGG